MFLLVPLAPVIYCIREKFKASILFHKILLLRV
nr:MAG TPA: hypothetical protein [Caudoviricetes sp.]DAQ25872.1 MAG TPA: hypothetical protein [Caudoviricetes sp.]